MTLSTNDKALKLERNRFGRICSTGDALAGTRGYWIYPSAFSRRKTSWPGFAAFSSGAL